MPHGNPKTSVRPALASKSFLYSFCKIQTYPTISILLIGFQQPPAACSLPIRSVHNGKDAFARVLPGLGIVRSRSFADIQVGNADLYQIRRKSRLGGVQRIAGFTKHRVPRILIGAPFRIVQAVSGSLLRSCIRLGLRTRYPTSVEEDAPPEVPVMAFRMERIFSPYPAPAAQLFPSGLSCCPSHST